MAISSNGISINQNSNIMKQNIISISLALSGIILRLLPHEPNMTPITAIVFASALYLGKKWSLALPITIIFVSDLIIGFYDWKIMLSVYGSFVLIAFLSWVVQKHRTFFTITMTVFGSSAIFFLVTNAAVWAFSSWYEKSFSGLLYAYELGLPFWRNMLVGDIFYTAILVGIFEKHRFLSTIRSVLLNQRISRSLNTPY